MVLPTTTTPPASCCSYLVDPIVNSWPCQKISYVCSTLASVVQKIASCVASIFTTIVNFVKSRLCCITPANPPAGTAPTTNTPTPPNGPNLLAGTPLAGTPPAAPAGVNVVEQAKAFLAPLVSNFQINFSETRLEAAMQNEQTVKTILADYLVYKLVMEEPAPGETFPFMITQGMAHTPITFMSKVQNLRASFAELKAQRMPTENISVGEAVQLHFMETHLWKDASQLNPDQDVFDTATAKAAAESNIPDSPANIFYAQLNTLAGNFVNQNRTFTDAVKIIRTEYLIQAGIDHLSMLLEEVSKKWPNIVPSLMQREAAAFFARVLIYFRIDEALNIPPAFLQRPNLETLDTKIIDLVNQHESAAELLGPLFICGTTPPKEEHLLAPLDEGLKALSVELMTNNPIFTASVNKLKTDYLKNNTPD